MTERPNHNELLGAFLAEQSVPCPVCGYDLRALQGHMCPECGEGLVLRVGLEATKMGAFITGLVALAVATGFSGVFGLLILVIGSDGDYGFLLSLFVEFSLAIGLLIVWITMARRIRRLSDPVRWIVALGCWLFTLVEVVVFIVLVKMN